MSSKSEKVEHVLSESKKGSHGHVCHYPGCGRECPPAKWGCRSCWFKLPKHLREKLWAAYRPGQETDKRPSREYIEVAEEIEAYVLAQQAGTGKLF